MKVDEPPFRPKIFALQATTSEVVWCGHLGFFQMEPWWKMMRWCHVFGAPKIQCWSNFGQIRSRYSLVVPHPKLGSWTFRDIFEKKTRLVKYYFNVAESYEIRGWKLLKNPAIFVGAGVQPWENLQLHSFWSFSPDRSDRSPTWTPQQNHFKGFSGPVYVFFRAQTFFGMFFLSQTLGWFFSPCTSPWWGTYSFQRLPLRFSIL